MPGDHVLAGDVVGDGDSYRRGVVGIGAGRGDQAAHRLRREIGALAPGVRTLGAHDPFRPRR
jgi:glyoxylase-like metal-dependent hydrolase (beta-lactamase superfamily II)